MKVYCKNCKYGHIIWSWNFDYRLQRNCIFISKTVGRLSNCKHYRPKWHIKLFKLDKER